MYVDERDRVRASAWVAQAMLRFDPRGAGEVRTPESAADKIVVYRY